MVVKRVVNGLVATAVVVGGALTAVPAEAADLSVWDRVAACESSGNWAINTGNGYYGGVQFSASTWAAFGGRDFAPNAHQATKAQQIAIARRTLSVQGPRAWPTCSVKAGLTKDNGGADRWAMPEGENGTPAPAPAPSNELTVNGDLDRPTVVALQRWVGTTPDGIWGGATTRALQAKVGAGVDGVRGPETTRAVQRLVGATVDGIWGPQTTRALQAYLLKVG